MTTNEHVESKPKRGNSNPVHSEISVGSIDREDEYSSFLRPPSVEPGSSDDTDMDSSSAYASDGSVQSSDEDEEMIFDINDQEDHGEGDDVTHEDQDDGHVEALEHSDIDDPCEDIQPRLKRIRLH
ncbi:predicted protein [Lichtheimia corymbifera JMRC:FSU:9682]|uniref:Uncharacterized protein n=1 Tax=Lichtheimia corymbifera JMRC:FSU:9682 TaxID=1263082 RepID=A0A068RPM4_9FUNG|nr:predicted protein [Lichtheimia corymbifera JMRC:FSU:9682]